MNLFRERSPDTVNVEFVDEVTGRVFAKAAFPPDRLPDTFALNTTMHIGADEWHVVSAVPAEKKEFVRSRNLRLVLRKIFQMDPKKILFTLPSICNFVGELGSEPRGGRELQIHEDIWRNIELISRNYESDVDKDLDEVL